MQKIVFTVAQNKWLHCRQIATRAIIYIAAIRGEMVAQLYIPDIIYTLVHTVMAMQATCYAIIWPRDSYWPRSQMSMHFVLATPNTLSNYAVNWLTI